MKKIVALALCLVLALSLCATAMAAADTYDMYQATSGNLKNGAVKSTAEASATNVVLTEVAAKTNSDGSGNVAYVSLTSGENGTGSTTFVKTNAPTVSSFAVTEKGKTAVLYYVNAITVVDYDVAATEFTKFGTTTGMVYSPAVNATYYIDADETVYIGATGGAKKLLVGGEVVKAKVVTSSSTLTAGDVVAPNYVVTATKASATAGKLVPTEVTDTNSNTKYTAIYKTGEAPAGSKILETFNDPIYDAVYVLVGSAAASTTTGVTSAKTFDAGVALYAGMALMSVAGSAVVIGKKKEF